MNEVPHPHMAIRLYTRQAALAADQLSALQRLLEDLLPEWSRTITVRKGEEMPGVTIGGDTTLSDAVGKVAPSRHGIGSAMLSGSYEGLTVFISSCPNALPVELNEILIEVIGLPVIEKVLYSEWVIDFTRSATRSFPVRYATAYLNK
jgi:hypothetical protein